MIDRAKVASIIPVEYYDEIFNATVEQSAALQLGRRLRNMSARELTLTVQETLPMAGFVTGDAGLKPETDLKWKDRIITAEEIAVYIPVPDNVLADARDNGTDLWTTIRPQLATAFGKVIDGAILFGTNKPASWINGIATSAAAAGSVVAGSSDGYKDIMESGGLISKVEENGFVVNGFVGSVGARAFLRGIRTTDGYPLFNANIDPITKKPSYDIYGSPIVFPMNGAMEGANKPLLIAGDFNELVYSIREEITFEIFNQGVVSDAAGKVIINLMTQDTSVIRAKMRLGWQLPNPVNHINETEASRYPFAILNKKAD